MKWLITKRYVDEQEQMQEDNIVFDDGSNTIDVAKANANAEQLIAEHPEAVFSMRPLDVKEEKNYA